jgi:hypothetical protein
MQIRAIRIAPLVAAQLTALAALSSACGNVAIPMAGAPEENAKEEPSVGPRTGAGTEDGVRLGLALPEDFDQGDEGDGIKAEDSSIADELEAALADQGIKVTCDDGQVLTWDLAKEQGLRGIFELTVINFAAQPYPWDEEPKPDYDDGEEPYEHGDFSTDVSDSGDLKDDGFHLHDRGDERDCRDDEDEKDRWSDDAEADYASTDAGLSGMAITHLAIPFVCSGNATIQLLSLETSGKYVIEGALYTAEGGLSYQGSSEAFSPAGTTDVQLGMQKVQESTGAVDVHVVFEDQPTMGSTDAPAAVAADMK